MNEKDKIVAFAFYPYVLTDEQILAVHRAMMRRMPLKYRLKHYLNDLLEKIFDFVWYRT